MINIYKIGRIVAFSPAELGPRFEQSCTVTVMERQQPSPANKWKATRIPVKHPLFWYADDPDTKQKLFCTYGGYFTRLHKELKGLGLDVKVSVRRAHGLPPPDISKLQGIQWRPHQKEVVAHILTSDGGLVVCPTAQGKCLGRGTRVLMYDGTVKCVEDVAVGDKLMGPDSAPRNVLSVTSGRDSLYRIDQRVGDSYVVNGQHQVSLRMTPGNKLGFLDGEIVDVALSEYLKKSKSFKHCAKGWKAAVDFSNNSGHAVVPPYMFGVWLGDGSAHDFTITTADIEIEDAVNAFAASLGQRVVQVRNPNNRAVSLSIRLPGAGRSHKGTKGLVLSRHLRELGVYRNKHIPHSYKTASAHARLELLAGLLDTDGHLNRFGSFEYVSVSEELANDVAFVARSLGFSVTKHLRKKTCCNNGVVGTYYVMIIGGDVCRIPCRVKRKQAIGGYVTKNPLVTSFTVTEVGEGDYFGFMVDGDHRFLLGDFTVTHNSFMMRQIVRVYPTAKLVITVSSLDVAKTLYEELKDFVPDLGFCGTGMQNPRRVTVAVTNSLDRCDFDANLVLVDECHTALAPSVIKKLNQFRRAKLFGLTASPDGRSDGGDGFMEALFGPTLYDMTYQQGVAAGNIVQLRVKMYRSSKGQDLSGIDDKTYVDRHGIILNKDRNDLVVRATRELEQELGPDAQILIMVDKIEHAYLLGQQLKEYTIVTGVMPKERRDELVAMGVLTPESKLCSAADRDRYRRAFEKNQLKRVIATRVWEKGVDFRDLQGLVRADGLASPIAACQIPGRLSRLGKTVDKSVGVLVDFADLFSKNLKARSRKRLSWYTKCGWIIENHV